MSSVRLVSLYSGSSGNSFLIATPQGSILIDAGKNARQLCRSLEEVGVAPEELRAIFITHEHHDHISALPVFLKKHPMPVHLPIGCAYRLQNEPAAVPCLCPHPPAFTEEVCGIRVTSFVTPHDSQCSVGYRMEIPQEDGTRLLFGYATDIGYVSPAVREGLTGCDAVILESNHDTEMLRDGPYPPELKRRVASRYGHLSNSESAEFAAYLCMNGTRSLMLAHLSGENNTPEVAYSACLGAVGDPSVSISVAQPDGITEMIL